MSIPFSCALTPAVVFCLQKELIQMLSAPECAILEALSHGSKEQLDLLSPSTPSEIAGVSFEPSSIISAYSFLSKSKYLEEDALCNKVMTTPQGREKLEKSDLLKANRENFLLLDKQLSVTNDLNKKLVDELHSQADLAEKRRIETVQKQKREKWEDRFFSFVLGVLATIVAALILKLFGG